MTSATATARVIVDELVRSGIEHAVLAPGSRSAPLAMALFDAETSGRLRLHVRFDERSAGFLALGIAKTSSTPVPVVTTSGTAVANLHPAVLEAHHGGVPLLVITADRPAVMRGTGANQTTDQVHIYGSATRYFADLSAEPSPGAAARAAVARAIAAGTGAFSEHPGPVHVNVQFTEPLVPDQSDSSVPEGRSDGAAWTTVVPRSDAPPAVELPLGPMTVVVAGDSAGPPARVLAEAANWPLLAEPTSGARTGTAALRTYRLLLGDSRLANDIARVVVFGHPTLSRPASRLLSRADVEVVVVSATPSWPDSAHLAARVAPAVSVAGADDPSWLARWTDADREVGESLDALLGAEPDLTPYEVAEIVAGAVPPRGLFVVGSSNPIRDLDLMNTPYPVGERRKIIANRGLAGIDGTVSTAIGAALGRNSSRSLALLGDLTFLHDANGLILGPEEPRPDLTLVVVNDNGGRIFATLEQGAPQYASGFERVFGTPHGVDLSALCAASSTPHRRVTSRHELVNALTEPPSGIDVIEVPVDGTRRRDLDHRIRSLPLP